MVRPGIPVLVAAALATGCANADGLLIDVTLDPGVDPTTVGAIDLWVGVPSDDPRRYVRAERPADLQAVDAWPFQVLIEPDAADRAVLVGAFGYPSRGTADRPPVVAGTLDTPVTITAGELVTVTLTLRATDAPDSDCLLAGGGPLQTIAIVPAGTDVTDPAALAALDCDDDGDTVGDCDDLDPTVQTGGRELCDGLDNNCNGICDEGFDLDADARSRCDYPGCGVPTCSDGSAPPPAIVGSCDCDDTDPEVHPGAIEAPVCDAVDSNCDATDGGAPLGSEVGGNQIDDDCDGTCDIDDDKDLIASDALVPTGVGTWATTCDPVLPDCDDTAREIYPNALETCDGVDDDCDLATEVATGPCFVDPGDGCVIGDRVCDELVPAWLPVCAPGAFAVPSSICAQWPVVADEPWPERAMYDLAADGERETCTLAVWREPSGGASPPNALCEPSPRARIDSPFANEQVCSSTILGGAIRGGWQLGLVPRGDDVPPATEVATCDVELVVVDIAGLGTGEVRLPSIWVAIVQSVGDGDPEDGAVIPVEIRPAYADAMTSFACPPGRSLRCQ